MNKFGINTKQIIRCLAHEMPCNIWRTKITLSFDNNLQDHTVCLFSNGETFCNLIGGEQWHFSFSYLIFTWRYFKLLLKTRALFALAILALRPQVTPKQSYLGQAFFSFANWHFIDFHRYFLNDILVLVLTSSTLQITSSHLQVFNRRKSDERALEWCVKKASRIFLLLNLATIYVKQLIPPPPPYFSLHPHLALQQSQT